MGSSLVFHLYELLFAWLTACQMPLYTLCSCGDLFQCELLIFPQIGLQGQMILNNVSN